MFSTIYFLGYWFLPMCIFQMYVFISFKVIIEILPVYLLRYLFWFFIFLRQVFIFRAVLLLTLCQCAALRCYISWVCIIIKPSLYILNLCLLLCAWQWFSRPFPQRWMHIVLYNHSTLAHEDEKMFYFAYSLLTSFNFGTIHLARSEFLQKKNAEGRCK